MAKKFTLNEGLENLLNANENARKVEKLEKKVRVISISGGVVAAVSSVITYVITAKKTHKIFDELKKKNIQVEEKINEEIDHVKNKIDEFEESFTEVVNTDKEEKND